MSKDRDFLMPIELVASIFSVTTERMYEWAKEGKLGLRVVYSQSYDEAFIWGSAVAKLFVDPKQLEREREPDGCVTLTTQLMDDGHGNVGKYMFEVAMIDILKLYTEGWEERHKPISPVNNLPSSQ